MKAETKIGPWTLTGLIAEGAFGRVYRCKRVFLRKVRQAGVMKLPLPDGVSTPKIRETFEKEAEILGILQSDNIVGLLDCGEHNGEPYIVMELVPGLNLHEFITEATKDGRVLAPLLIAHIITGVVRGLDHAHAREIDGEHQGIVHRDIKTMNVLLSKDGMAKLADFGIARATSIASSATWTKGTIPFMAPEHLATGTATPASDRFAVGAVLWELLMGRPFRGDVDVEDLLRVVGAGEVPAITRQPPAKALSHEIPMAHEALEQRLFRTLCQICRDLLSYEPADRPENVVILDLLKECPAHQAKVLGHLVSLYAGKQADKTGLSLDGGDGYEVGKDLKRTLALAAMAQALDASAEVPEGSSEPEEGAPVLFRKRAASPASALPAPDAPPGGRDHSKTGPARNSFLAPGALQPPSPSESSVPAPTVADGWRPPVSDTPATEKLEPLSPASAPVPDHRGTVHLAPPSARVAGPLPSVRTAPTPVPLVEEAAPLRPTPLPASVTEPGGLHHGDVTAIHAAVVPAERSAPTMRVGVALVLVVALLLGIPAGILARAYWFSEVPEIETMVHPEAAVAAATRPLPTPTKSPGVQPIIPEASDPTPVTVQNDEPPKSDEQPKTDDGEPQPLVSNHEAAPRELQAKPTGTASAVKKERKSLKRKATQSQALVSLRLGFIDSVMVRIDSKSYTLTMKVRDEIDVKVAAGRHRVRWRFSQDKPWRVLPRFDFGANTHHVFVFGGSGPKHSEMAQQ